MPLAATPWWTGFRQSIKAFAAVIISLFFMYFTSFS